MEFIFIENIIPQKNGETENEEGSRQMIMSLINVME